MQMASGAESSILLRPGRPLIKIVSMNLKILIKQLKNQEKSRSLKKRKEGSSTVF